MKKIMTVFICFVFALIPLNVFADFQAEIYGDAVYSEKNSIVFVPVYISHNPGIMGFKITVKYDPEVFSLPTISRGTVTEKGIMNDGIGIGEAGAFDVVWNSTENVIGDGTVFIISFNTAETIKKKSYELSFSFSQDDTFDEEYRNVMLNCKNIEVVFDEPPEGYLTKNAGDLSGREPNCDDIVLAIETALRATESDSISAVPENNQKKLITSANENIMQITGFSENFFAGIDDMEAKYTEAIKDKFVNDVIATVDPKDISDIINNALKKVGAEKIEELNENQKEEFVKIFSNGISKNDGFLALIPDKIKVDSYVESIKEIRNLSEQRTSFYDLKWLFENKMYIFFSGMLMLIFSIIILIVRRKCCYDKIKN